MISFSFTQLAEIAGIVSFVGTVVIFTIRILLNYQQQKLREELRHEIDRLAIESHHTQCYLEKTTNYSRPHFSGIWRSVFDQKCYPE